MSVRGGAVVIFFWLGWSALAGTPEVLPGSLQEVVIESSAEGELREAVDDLVQGRFERAGRRLAALAEAGDDPQIRYLEALARYEDGRLRDAERAARRGLEKAPDHAPLASVLGLVLADLGRGEEALPLLEQAEAGAKAGDDRATLARVRLNRGLVALDQGALTEAEAAFRAARAEAEGLNDALVIGLADRNLALVAASRGEVSDAVDAVGRVADRLRRGDLAGARQAAAAAAPADRRGAIHALLARAAVQRAEGRLDEASGTLQQALMQAREAGLPRETGAALAELGMAQALGGRHRLALELLEEAVAMAAGTSFRVNEGNWRVEAGRVAARLGEIERARLHLAGARTAAEGVEDPTLQARVRELTGLVADEAVAGEALEAARAAFEGLGFHADAARVAAAAVELHAGRDPQALEVSADRAREAFARAGDELGPAHVAIAEGLGRARRADLEGALAAFASASASAEAVGGERGLRVARIARENGAQTLLALGHGAEAAERARDWGLDDALRRQELLGGAEADYAAALESYGARRHDEARDGFERAWKVFLELGEEGYARQARRARAWAEWHALQGQEPATALPVFRRLVDEAGHVHDDELRVRAKGSAALAAATLDRADAVPSLREAAVEAERIGLDEVAGRCWAELAERESDLLERVRAARRAATLRDDVIGTYALYAVAVAAFNEGSYGTALELAEEALPRAGADLQDPVRAVLEAARAAR